MQLVVGRIVRAHGVRGEVTVDVRTDDPGLRFAPGSRLGTDPPISGPLTVESFRWHSERLLVRFAELPDRSAAEDLLDTALVVDSDALPPSAEPEEFNDHELFGLVAVRVTGEQLGTVTDVQHVPGQDLVAVTLNAGGEVLVPFVAAIIREVDRTAGILVLDPPPGLIDMGERE